jgi:lysophospholipase L1-like esterase
MKIGDSIRTVICYGDSNTWGNIPRSDERYPRNIRWPGALQDILGNTYDVISEGLCGRTFVALDPAKQHRTGITHLQSILETNDPIDLVIVMLGTNDVKTTYGLTAEEISQDLEETIFLIRSEKVDLEKDPKILIICPPPVIDPKTKDLDGRMVNGPEIFKSLPKYYKEVAERNDCEFINAGEYISSSDVDGYHLGKEAHLRLAEVISEKVKFLIP